jgi:hypothetical protein
LEAVSFAPSFAAVGGTSNSIFLAVFGGAICRRY